MRGIVVEVERQVPLHVGADHAHESRPVVERGLVERELGDPSPVGIDVAAP